MRLSSFGFILLPLLIFSFPLGAKSPENIVTLTLNNALQIAKKRNVEMIVAEERVQQAIHKIGEARSFLLPQITGTISETHQTKNLEAMGISIPTKDRLVGPFQTFDARIWVTQTLFDAPALQRLKSSKTFQTLSQMEQQKTEADTLALVALLYLEAKREEEKTAFTQTMVEVHQARLKLAQNEFQNGVGTSFNLTQKEADLAQAQSQQVETQTRAREKALDLIAALGLPVATQIQFVHEEIHIPHFSENSTTVLEHPDLKVAQKKVEQQQVEKKIAQAEYFPKLIATGDYGASGKSPQESEGTYSVGAQLSLPLSRGGGRKEKIQQSAHAIQIATAQMENTQKQVEKKIIAAREIVTRTQALWSASKTQTVAAQKRWQLAQEKLKVGVGTPLEVKEAKADWAKAKDQQSETQTAHEWAELNLIHSLGKISETMETLK